MASTILPSFQHERFGDEQDEIRLFRIKHGNESSLNCHIAKFQLSDPPPFVALSYVWGPPQPVCSIMLNDHTFHIRSNLGYFLQALRAGPTPIAFLEHVVDSEIVNEGSEQIWYWCDQISVDQTNLQERNHQVSLMDRIFSAASETIAWLGPGEPEREGDDLPDEYVDERMGKLHGRAEWRDLKNKYITFVQSPYWSRLWIVQEVLLSKKIHLMRGNLIISWKSLWRFVRQLQGVRGDKPKTQHARYQLSKHIPRPLVNLISERTYYATNWDTDRRLSYVLDSFGHLECENVKDKVFGLLGLVPSSKRPKVNYGLDVKEVLFEALSKVLEHETLMEFHSHVNFAKKLRGYLRVDATACSDQELFNFVQQWESRHGKPFSCWEVLK